jgi:hypothetical protein
VIVNLESDHALVEIVEHDGATYGPFDVGLTDLHVIEHVSEP